MMMSEEKRVTTFNECGLFYAVPLHMEQDNSRRQTDGYLRDPLGSELCPDFYTKHTLGVKKILKFSSLIGKKLFKQHHFAPNPSHIIEIAIRRTRMACMSGCRERYYNCILLKQTLD